MRIIAFTLACFLLLSCEPGNRKNSLMIEGYGITASNGMVVSAHPEASGIGIKILKEGGNAFDAAVATGFALAVAYPGAGNIGGGGFMVLRTAGGETYAIDYREKAPFRASREMFIDSAGQVIEGASTDTHLASGVPGSVDGLIEVHRKYGTLPFSKVIGPSIDLARNGFPLNAGDAVSLNSNREQFLKRNRKPTAFVKDSLWKEGDILKQPELAATLQLISDKGRDGFYTGRVAELIENEMKMGSGLIDRNDLMKYRSVWRDPLKGSYRGFKIITMSPPSGGGITLMQLLTILESHDISSMGFLSADAVHIMAEAERRAFADRAYFMGDPDFIKIPVETMTDKKYLEERMKSFNAGIASPSSDIGHGEIAGFAPEETTHYSVVDGKGNAVSVTTTLNGTYGNSIVVEGAGFLLNNEMDDFSVKPGYPNMFGLLGGEANSIKPGKRMLSSMTPTIIEKDGKLFLVLGSPGGSTIPTSVFQVIVNTIDFGMDIQTAVNAGRFHHQWLPDFIFYENNSLDSATIQKLIEKGHLLRRRGSIGRVNSIMRMPVGSFQAGADPRGNNSACGY
jgi:gamma-glutamyltranspeptidase/glutathione hydrolase